MKAGRRRGRISLVGALLVGGMACGSVWFAAKGHPRPTYTTDCEAPVVSKAEAQVRTDLALSEIAHLWENAPAIYGPYNRAEQRAIDFGHFFGAPMTDNPAYRLRISAAFSELSLIWGVAMAKGWSPCSVQRLVPDHGVDSVEEAKLKLQYLASALSRN